VSRASLTGRSRLALLVVLAAAVLTPALVLTTGSGGLSLTGVARAAARTQDAGTARFTANATENGVSAQRSAQLTGAIDFRVPRATMTFSAADGRFDGQMILDGTTWYAKIPAAAMLGLSQGKQWLKVDIASAGGNGAHFLAMLKLFDPARLFGLLRDAGTFTAVGPENLGGVDTTHYRGSVEARRLAAAIGAPAHAGDRHPDATFSADVWVDTDGYLRKLAFVLPAMADRPGADVDIELSDFGAPVQVTPPPADQVQDLTGLVRSTHSGRSAFVHGSRRSSVRVGGMTKAGK
jgi:LppX_LprAFG lipoprotein